MQLQTGGTQARRIQTQKGCLETQIQAGLRENTLADSRLLSFWFGQRERRLDSRSVELATSLKTASLRNTLCRFPGVP